MQSYIAQEEPLAQPLQKVPQIPPNYHQYLSYLIQMPLLQPQQPVYVQPLALPSPSPAPIVSVQKK
jgi:hypothetical protein